MSASAIGAPGPADRGTPTGRPADRPLPRARVISVLAAVPTRLLIDAELSPAARLIGSICYAKVEPGAMAVRLTNPQLQEMSGLKRTSLLDALRELEAAGWLYRLIRSDHAAQDHLLSIGYRNPWPWMPRRVLVLCGALPDPESFRLKGAPRRTVEGTPGRTFRIIGAGMDGQLGGPRPRRKGEA